MIVNAKIPKLRFREFVGEWQEKKLRELVAFSRGALLSKADIDQDGRYLCIHYGELFTKYHEVISTVKSRTNLDTKVDSEPGDILMPTSDVTPQGLARASVLKISGVKLGGDINILKPNSITSSIFLSYMLNAQKKRIMRIVSGTTVRHVYSKDLAKVEYRLPDSKGEQQKIAEFLTSVDERIELQDKKIKLLQKYKKGVMQKIFSQQIRFKDENGKDYPDWQEKKLYELCNTAKSGGTPTTTKKQYYEEGNIPFLAISDMTKQGKYLTETSKFITKEGFNNSASWIVPKGSIIYSMYASVGFVAINKIPIATSQAVINLIPNDQIKTDYLYYSLVELKEKVYRFVETGTQGNLNAQIVKNFKIPLPIIKEQQKIADLLTYIDDKIDLEKNKLKEAKQFKKALLQRMFV